MWRAEWDQQTVGNSPNPACCLFLYIRSTRDTLDHHKDEQEGLRANQAWNIDGGKNDENRSCPTSCTSWESSFFGKDNDAGGKQQAAGKERDQIWNGLTVKSATGVRL